MPKGRSETKDKFFNTSTHPLCSNVFILNPKVGDIVSISSPLNFLKIVVFPALSKPLCIVKEKEVYSVSSKIFLKFSISKIDAFDR